MDGQSRIVLPACMTRGDRPRRLPAAGSRSRRGYQERTNRSDDVDERPLSSTVTRPSAKVGVADPRKTSYFRMRASRSLHRTEGFSRVVQLHQIDPRHERAPGQGAAPGPFIGAPHDETGIVARSLGSPRGLVLPAHFTASDDGDSSGHLELCKPYGFALCAAHVNSIYVKKICRSADRQHCRKGLDLRPGEGVRPDTGSYRTRDVARGDRCVISYGY